MAEESALAVLVGAYLNQDLFEFYSDEYAAVDDFAKRDPDLAANLPGEIADALRRIPSEEGLESLLAGLGIEIEPGDITYREWLTQIAERVRAATADGV